ncbi:MAG: hypothetical protein ABMA15_14675 [Vicinamibacterales bacterium]
MNPAHLHLLLNHVPVLAVPFGLAVLAWATFRPRPELARLALVVFVFSALATIPTYLSGEPAEETIEGVAGVIEPWVEPHEEAALVSLILGEALGVLGLAGLWSARRAASLPRPMMMASLVLALATAGSLAYTANLGGLIRHTEIRGGSALPGAAEAPGGEAHDQR